MRKLLTAVVLTGAVLSASTYGQAYPTKPIKLVIGFAPGSATDNVARALAEPLAAELGQPVIVDYRPGAASTLASAQIARAAPDGYSVVLATNSSMATGPAGMVRNISYDPQKDFTSLGRVATVSFMLLGSKQLPASTLSELVDYSRKNKDKVSCASGNTNGLVFCELVIRTSSAFPTSPRHRL